MQTDKMAKFLPAITQSNLISSLSLLVLANPVFSKPTGANTELKNGSVNLWLHKPSRYYHDHYFCKAEEIEGTRYITEFEPAYNDDIHHKLLLFACEKPAMMKLDLDEKRTRFNSTIQA